MSISTYMAATGNGLDGYIADEVMPSIEILKADALQPLVPITRAITELPE